MDLHHDEQFLRFLAPGIDRHQFLVDYLSERQLKPHSLRLAGTHHIVLTPKAAQSPQILLLAHYDRAEGRSPGANDNSAAVFILAEAARQAQELPGWAIVFTDKEEAAGKEGAKGQGAYQLAKAMASEKGPVAATFIFDACGRGDRIIISTSAELLIRTTQNEQSARAFRDLRRMALDAARDIPRPPPLLAPTPFSDDAGFLAAGLPAQTITVLPSQEAERLVSALRGQPERARSLISAEKHIEGAQWMPETWLAMHSPEDSLQNLSKAQDHERVLQLMLGLLSSATKIREKQAPPQSSCRAV